MPVTTTAIVAEYLAIGTTAWLWLLPLLLVNYPALGAQPSLLSGEPNGLFVFVLGLSTYLLGVVTEALSWGMEKALVGRASSPRGWYGRVFKQNPSGEAWFAAQLWIWNSDRAERDFVGARQRIVVSRGIAANAFLALLICLLVRGSNLFWLTTGQLGLISLAIAILGTLSWFLATYEYHAKVQVAGHLKGHLPHSPDAT